jgi:hypothetical protein
VPLPYRVDPGEQRLAENLKTAESTATVSSLTEELAIKRRDLGDTHQDTLVTIHALAKVHYMNRDLALALTLMLEELDGWRQILGNEHLTTLTCLTNLAKVEFHMGGVLLRAAVFLMSEAVSTSQRVYGEEHPRTVRWAADLGMILTQAAREDAAILVIQRSFRRYREAMATTALGLKANKTSDRTARACVELQGNIAKLSQKIKDPGLLDRGCSVEGLAHITQELERVRVVVVSGDLDSAEKILRELLATLRDEETHSDVNVAMIASVIDMLTQVCYASSDMESVSALLEQNLTTFRQTLGDEDQTTLSYISDLAKVRFHLGDYQGAERLMSEAWSVNGRVFGDEHAITISQAAEL